jgi:hypothetical protein
LKKPIHIRARGIFFLTDADQQTDETELHADGFADGFGVGPRIGAGVGPHVGTGIGTAPPASAHASAQAQPHASIHASASSGGAARTHEASTHSNRVGAAATVGTAAGAAIGTGKTVAGTGTGALPDMPDEAAAPDAVGS